MGAPHHDAETRQRALEALGRHGSIRKAAAVAGVSRSALQRWAIELMPRELRELAEQAKAPPGAIPPDATPIPGLPANPDRTTAQKENAQAEKEYADAVRESLESDSTYTAQQAADLVATPPKLESVRWVDDLGDPLYLQAFRRYVSALANGAHPLQAQHVAQAVHPEFELSPEQEIAVRAGVNQLTFSERGLRALLLELADPPAYVKGLADEYSMDEATLSDLTDALASVYQDSYLAGVNAQLTALGRDPVVSITDPRVLQGIQDDAASRAQGIADTWAKDAASQVGQAWIDSQGVTVPSGVYEGDQGWAGAVGAAREDAMRQAMDDWVNDRSTWKSDLWAGDASVAGYNAAVGDFVANNDIADSFHVEPDEAQCVPGDCRVEPIGRLEQALRSWYDGPLVRLRTSSGIVLRTTPKHPILTGRGWLAAEKLREGDHVFRILPSRDHEGHAGPDHESHDVPSTVSDVFASLGVGTTLRAVRAHDFHGDGEGMEGEIHQVRPDAEVRQEEHVELAQLLLELGFARPLSHGTARTHLDSARRQPAVGGSGGHIKLSADLTERQPLLVQSDCLRNQRSTATSPVRAGIELAGTRSDADTAKPAGQVIACHPGRSRDATYRLAGLVASDEVIEVGRVLGFAGYVYNLATSGSSFLANGLIVHNCEYCQDAVDAGDVDIAEMDGGDFDFPAHPGCGHTNVPNISEAVDDTQDLWTAQGDSGEAVAMAEAIVAARAQRMAQRVDRSVEPRRAKSLALSGDSGATPRASTGNTGAMVAIYPDGQAAGQLAQPSAPNALAADDLHCTLAFLGKAMTVNVDAARAAVRNAAARLAPFTVRISGTGRFRGGDDPKGDAWYASLDAPALSNVRHVVIEELWKTPVNVALNHGFTPHMTLAYVPVDEPTPDVGVPVTAFGVNSLALVIGDDRYDFPLTGADRMLFGSPDQPRDERGRWAGGGGPATAQLVEHLGTTASLSRSHGATPSFITPDGSIVPVSSSSYHGEAAVQATGDPNGLARVANEGTARVVSYGNSSTAVQMARPLTAAQMTTLRDSLADAGTTHTFAVQATTPAGQTVYQDIVNADGPAVEGALRGANAALSDAVVASERLLFYNPDQPRGWHGYWGSGGAGAAATASRRGFPNTKVLAENAAKVRAAIKNAPVPSREDWEKGQDQHTLRDNRAGRGNSDDRASRMRTLMNTFGDGKRAPCAWCGRWCTPGAPRGQGQAQEDKIFTGRQGGRYKIANLLVACDTCNNARLDAPVRSVPYR